jgi:hypothetical protein
MALESEIKIARYKEVAKEGDELGRVIGVRRLRPSERSKFQSMTAELSGYETLKNDAGDDIQISHRLPLLIVACVCSINDGVTGDVMIPFPRNLAELYAMQDRLDDEGLKAAAQAFAKLNPAPPPEHADPDGQIDPNADAKN